MRSHYWEWIRSEAAKINSDGCSKVSEWHRECCLEHDLGYYHGRDPRAAWRLSLEDPSSPYWTLAGKIARSEVDQRFLDCMQGRSPLHEGSPRAAWRWLGVRVGGWLAWRNHRKVRP